MAPWVGSSGLSPCADCKTLQTTASTLGYSGQHNGYRGSTLACAPPIVQRQAVPYDLVQCQPQSRLTELPLSIFAEIVGLLPPADVGSARVTCKALREVLRHIICNGVFVCGVHHPQQVALRPTSLTWIFPASQSRHGIETCAATLCGLPSVRSLAIREVPHASCMPSLGQFMYWSHGRVPGPWLASISSLTSLSIEWGTGPCDAGFASLSQLPLLTSLTLQLKGGLRSPQMQLVAGIQTLRHLDLNVKPTLVRTNRDSMEPGLASLTRLQSLTSLILRGTLSSDPQIQQAVANLSQLPDLRSLQLYPFMLCFEATLAGMTALTELHVCVPARSQSDWQAVAGLPQLQRLSAMLSGSRYLAHPFGTGMSCMTDLELRQVDVQGFAEFAALTALRRLSLVLAGRAAAGTSPASLANLAPLHALHTCIVSGHALRAQDLALTPACLDTLATAWRRLRHLEYHGPLAWPPGTALDLRGFKHLTHLQLNPTLQSHTGYIDHSTITIHATRPAAGHSDNAGDRARPGISQAELLHCQHDWARALPEAPLELLPPFLLVLSLDSFVPTAPAMAPPGWHQHSLDRLELRRTPLALSLPALLALAPRSISLHNCCAGDLELSALAAGLPSLASLEICELPDEDSTPHGAPAVLSDSVFVSLGALRHLRRLALSARRLLVMGQGLAPLAALTGLNSLAVAFAALEGGMGTGGLRLDRLSALTGLRSLRLGSMPCSSLAQQLTLRLQAVLPACDVQVSSHDNRHVVCLVR